MMKLLIQSAMIFFGTLMAAGLVALGEPGGARVEPGALERPRLQAMNRLIESAQPWVELTPAHRAR